MTYLEALIEASKEENTVAETETTEVAPLETPTNGEGPDAVRWTDLPFHHAN